jgi:hypothetical protein
MWEVRLITLITIDYTISIIKLVILSNLHVFFLNEQISRF